MTATLHPAMTQVLRSAREDLNARFAAAKRMRPSLDPDAFTEFLCEVVDPLITAVDAVNSDRAADVALCAYDLGLELVGKALVGPRARAPVVGDMWRRVAPAAAALIAHDPLRVLASLTNAVHQLAATPGARPEDWIDTMAQLAPRCRDVDQLLAAGQVAAWRAGMSHYRAGALAAADTLPPEIARAALGAPGTSTWPQLRSRLTASPWYDPSDDAAPIPRVTGRAGAFRGFGGLFVEPPRLGVVGDHVLVRSGGEAWLLVADAFGATFHRATPDEAAAPPVTQTQHVSVTGHTVTVDGVRIDVAELGVMRDVIATPTTVALASPLSHAVVLVART